MRSPESESSASQIKPKPLDKFVETLAVYSSGIRYKDENKGVTVTSEHLSIPIPKRDGTLSKRTQEVVLFSIRSNEYPEVVHEVVVDKEGIITPGEPPLTFDLNLGHGLEDENDGNGISAKRFLDGMVERGSVIEIGEGKYQTNF